MQDAGKKPDKKKIREMPFKSDVPNAPTIDFEGMITRGSPGGPDGFTAQTVNGTAKWRGTGWNKNGRGGWAAQDYCSDSAQLEPDATRPAGRSNRTGE